MSKRPVLLDSSFLIDLEREVAGNQEGPARRMLTKLRGRRILLSIVSVEELLEGAPDEMEAIKWLSQFTIQPIGLAHARRCANLQRNSPRRLSENDAWIVATIELLNADVVGRDRKAFDRLGARYLKLV